MLIFDMDTRNSHAQHTQTKNATICAGESCDMIFSLLCLTTHSHDDPQVLEAWE